MRSDSDVSRRSGRIEFPTWTLPAVQAALTATSTALGVLLVLLWRPDRPREVPFYSDSSHNDPERVILAVGENLACFFMPIVAIAEYLYLSRLSCQPSSPVRPFVPRVLRCCFPSWLFPTTRAAVRLNFLCTLSTTLFFFITANVPSKRPFTLPHQVAASALIFAYAMQSTLKAVLASTFDNYAPAHPVLEGPARTHVHSRSAHSLRLLSAHAWRAHHMKLRLTLTGTLWFALVSTWLLFQTRYLARRFLADSAVVAMVRAHAASLMAIVVYAATAACVVLMVIMAIDLRADRLVIGSVQGAEVGWKTIISEDELM